MQVSVETTSSIERRMTVGVPADQIDQKVEQRLQQTAKTIRINGFRPGKVPTKVVKKRFGQSVLQEVLGEVMRDAYIEAIGVEGITPVGYPRFEAKSLEEGQDFEFVAVFEVYPEIAAVEVSTIELTKPEAEIVDQDIDNMIEVLRRQHATLKAVQRKSKAKDLLTVDYVGYLDRVAFQGGTGKDQKITLGSGQMIPGFEDGLIGAKEGETVNLELKFPEDYANQDLAGKEVKFEVTVKVVEEAVLPELNEEFFAKYGVDSHTVEEFKAEIAKNMARELKQAVSNKLKQQIVEALIAQNELAVPASIVETEINKMKREAINQFGGGQQMDLAQLPSELFKDQADRRVKTGLLFAAIIKQNELKADLEKVNAKIQELAEAYETPADVIDWYGKQENRVQIESLILEDEVVELVLSKAKVEKVKMSYEDAVKPEKQKT